MIKYKHSARTGLLFVAPLLLFLLIYMVYPVIYNIQISFFNWNGIAKTKDFVGFENYRTLFSDSVFSITTRNFFYFAVATVSIQCVLGLLLASMFRNAYFGRDMTKAVIFMPAMLSPIIIGSVFFRLLDPNIGYLKEVLKLFGIRGPLSDPQLAIWVIIMVNIWQWTGYSMTLYYGTIVSISDDIFDSAMIDGATQRQILRHIIVPFCRGTTYNLTIVGVIGALKQFDLVVALTGGGPANATQTFATYLYQVAFVNFRQGYSSAISMIMFLIALVITIVQLRAYNAKSLEV